MRSRPPRSLPLIGALALLLLAAAPVSAHGGLTYSNPAANAALLEAPTNVELIFAEAIDPTLSEVTLFDEAGLPLAGVGPLVLDATGLDVQVTLPQLAPGLFTVAYQTTSAVDGHVVEGTFAFLYDPSGTRPAPNLPTESSSPSNSPLLVAMRWLALAGGLLTLGIAIFWLVSARPALAAANVAPAPTLAPWGWIGLSAGLAFGGIAAYLTVSAQSLGIGVGHPGHGGGIIPLDFAAPFGATPFAMAMRLALVGSGAAGLIAAARHFEVDEAHRRARVPRERERPLLLAVLVAALASLAGAALAGHASSLGGPIFATVDWLHLISVAAWLGALPGLLILAARSRLAADLPVAGALRRHSRVALVAAPLVALTGIANSPVVLGAAREVVASDYGNLLLAKALLFSIAIALGAVNFFFVRAEALRRALPVMAVELAIGALAVVVAAGLTTGQPSATRSPVLVTSPAGVLQLLGVAGESNVHIAVTRPEPGLQRYQVSIAYAGDGTFRTDVRGVTLTFTPPAGTDLPVRSVSLAPGADPWLWGSGGEYTPIVGDWKLGVQVAFNGASPDTASFHVAVIPTTEPELLPPPSTGIAVPEPLARLWSLLPSGLLGWLLPAALALALITVRLGARRARWSTAATVALAALLLVIGLGVVSRETLRAADSPPASASARKNPAAATEASVKRGHSLFLANCASCHGANGRGDGPAAATLLGDPGDLASGVPALSDGALAYRIGNGSLGTGMPGFALTLTPADRWDVVNYLRSAWPTETR